MGDSEASNPPTANRAVKGCRSALLRGSASKGVGEHLGLVVYLVACGEQQRNRSVVTLDVEKRVEQLPVNLELPPVPLGELRPALDIVAVPLAELSRRCNIGQSRSTRRRYPSDFEGGA